jgi:hypothetical protein
MKAVENSLTSHQKQLINWTSEDKTENAENLTTEGWAEESDWTVIVVRAARHTDTY